ncbi:MAG: mechanosensitive ion channel protein MscS [Crocinitomicaceae bacterium]|jgi:small conductance mechanosensitive channel|nr:mechanosensitive ion channel protein MscS [Crocinitomicaceae bacterium]
MKQLEKLFGYNYQDINQLLIRIGTNVLIAAAIFIIGFWLAKFASRTVRKVLTRSRTDAGLISFLTSLTSIALKVLVIITGINQLGIEMTSFVAILGAAGLAVGMAFSGTLSNFAGGVMILAFKPFKVGDTIKAMGEEGVVKEIQIFNTYLNTADNKVIILPNGPVANGMVINFTREDKRRVDVAFKLNNGTNLAHAKEVIEAYIKQEKRILKDPKPVIGIAAITHENIDLAVNVWAKTSDNKSILHAMNEYVYLHFQEKDINDSHLKNASS